MKLKMFIEDYSELSLCEEELLCLCELVEDDMYVSETAKEILDKFTDLLQYLEEQGFERG